MTYIVRLATEASDKVRAEILTLTPQHAVLIYIIKFNSSTRSRVMVVAGLCCTMYMYNTSTIRYRESWGSARFTPKVGSYIETSADDHTNP